MSDFNPEVTAMGNEITDVAKDESGKSFLNVEAAALAREKGWAEPVEYDYSKYNSTERPADNADAPTWASGAAKYEWSDEYGDVGPPNEELEQMLFHGEFASRTGVKFDHLREIKVTAETTHQPAPIRSFDDAGLHPVVLNNIRLCGYQIPTPIQAYSIPAVLAGNDLIAVAQTGSGKTAAFLIPVLSKLMGKAKKLAAPRPYLGAGFNEHTDSVRGEPLVVIVVPTRELATQIFDEARRLCYRSMLRPCVVYGGGPLPQQRIELQKGCDILIGTPGRLLDFMDKPHILSLQRVKYTIIDEADEMLHPDWESEFKQILSGGDANEDADHRYLMFSATFNKDCRELARKYLSNDHVRIRIGRAGSAHKNVKQQVIFAEESMKKKCLYDLLMAMPPSRTLIFVNGKKQADLLDDYLFNMGLPSTSIHSDRTQREREDALRAFKSAKSPILVATGVSARGLDIKNVMHVVNFDLPSMTYGGIDEYIHRIGRTARIGNEGLATSLYNHDRDVDIGPALVKVLLECEQPIPDFLEDQKPAEGEELFADDDTDNEGDEKADGDDAWGTEAPAANDGWGAEPAAPAAGAGDWGAPTQEPAPQADTSGWGAETAAPSRKNKW
ncbi:hypothetical protein FQN54_004780 [Arachnomyces sp. PD_36]|nr:hypothetical protein FQN54_004780 [Arachnomyces sp. PD_36]